MLISFVYVQNVSDLSGQMSFLAQRILSLSCNDIKSIFPWKKEKKKSRFRIHLIDDVWPKRNVIM